jgi:hypothetical protein
MTIEVKVPSITKSSELQAIMEKYGDQPARYVFSPSHNIEFDRPLKVYNDTEFAGSNCNFYLMKHAKTSIFTASTPLISPIYPTSAENLIFHDINFDCKRDYQKYVGALYDKPWGHGYHNIFMFGVFGNTLYTNSKNIHIYDITAKNSLGDLVRGEGVSNCLIHDIRAENLGHDVIHLVAENSEIYNVKAKLAVNAGVRLRSSKNTKIHDCEFEGTPIAYSPGITIQSTAENWITEKIYIYNNKIFKTLGPGIQVAGSVPNNGLVQIHHNIISECGQMPASVTTIKNVGGCVVDGVPTVIEYNTFYNNLGYSICFGAYDVESTYRATHKVRYNIIKETQPALKQGIYSGTGIANLTGSRNTIEVTGNCQYGNSRANHYQVVYTKPINLDPLFVDDSKGDFHLKSIYGHYTSSGYVLDNISSPCISFSSKSEIGAYNSSQEASKYEAMIDPKSLPALAIPRGSQEDAEKLLKLLKELGVLTDRDYYYYLNVEA